MPPSMRSADAGLITSMPLTSSDAMLAKSSVRPAPAVKTSRPSIVGSTCVSPRTTTPLPSPRSRAIWTPAMRWSASATLVSGSLSISSATIESLISSRARLRSRAARMLARPPTTSTVCDGGSCAAHGMAEAANSPHSLRRRHARPDGQARFRISADVFVTAY